MNRKVKNALIIIIALVGIGLLSYPKVSDWFNSRTQTSAIQEFSLMIENTDDEAIAAAWEAARAYNAALAGGDMSVLISDPFDGDGETDSDFGQLYYSMLNLSQTMGFIEIPKINVSLPFYHGTSEEALQKGAGHLMSSSLPVGGADTHAVITGHRGLPSATLFTNLDELEVGDRFYIHVLDAVLTYEVETIEVIEPQNTQSLQIIPGEDYVTLMTCTPYGINSHRLLLHSVRVEDEPEPVEYVPEVTQDSPYDYMWMTVAGEIVLVILLLAIVIGNGVNKRRAKKSKDWIDRL